MLQPDLFPKNILIIYHANCLDGFGAAYAAWVKFGDNADYIPARYGDQPPDVTGKEVYILDFSYPYKTLYEMYDRADSITVLDHHKTAQENLKNVPFAIFDMGKSGCRLAWEYFNPQWVLPFALQMIEDRDLWRFHLSGSNPFCEAMYTIEMDFKEWSKIINHDYKITAMIQLGGELLRIKAKEIQSLIKNRHELFIFRHTVLACNAAPKYASDLGHELAKITGTFGATYYYNGDKQKWNFSLRSVEDFDVSIIAKSFGGGGHKNAAGFEIEDELFMKIR